MERKNINEGLGRRKQLWKKNDEEVRSGIGREGRVEVGNILNEARIEREEAGQSTSTTYYKTGLCYLLVTH